MGARSPLLTLHGDDFAWSLLDASPDATLIVSSTGEIVFVNDHAAELFGFAADDLLGRVVEDLLPAALAGVHRAHRARYRAEPTVRAMGAGRHLWARRSDGTEVPVEISLSPLRLGDSGYTVAAVRDISDRVAAEDQLHRVLQTLDASDDGVFIWDAATLRFSFVNEGAVRLVGYSRDELSVMTMLHLNPYAKDGEHRNLVGRLLADRAASVVREAVLVRKDGSEVAVEKTYRAAPEGRDGNSWIITLARDLSARREAEAQLQGSRDALRQAEQVVAVAAERERIARDLHDTVIQRLFGEGLSLQAAIGVADDPDKVRLRLQSTIDGLDETIRELRTTVFSLSMHGGGNAPGGLRGRLLEVITDATPALGLDPRLEFDGAIETTTDTVADHLVPALREALSNVAKHARARNVRVRVSVDQDVTLTVTDDGAGVPAEVLGGHGLENLRSRAHELGGEFRIEARPEGGSIVTWRVPASAGARSNAEPG